MEKLETSKLVEEKVLEKMEIAKVRGQEMLQTVEDVSAVLYQGACITGDAVLGEERAEVVREKGLEMLVKGREVAEKVGLGFVWRTWVLAKGFLTKGF